MKKNIFSALLLSTKFLTLLCFTTMGGAAMAQKFSQKAPCHEKVFSAEIREDFEKTCKNCLSALNLWSENYIEAVEFKIPNFILPSLKQRIIWRSKPTYQKIVSPKYRPPPQVEFINAFHLPQKSTVIIV